nr:contractile injection system tape measure protein [uncultured Lacibacter sp.]
MSTTVTHSIGKLSFHLKGVETGKVFAMRQQAANYLQHEFARMAEDVFDEFALNDELLFIPQLSIELKLSGNNFDLKKEEYRLREQIREQIAAYISKQQLNQITQSSGNDEQPYRQPEQGQQTQNKNDSPESNLLLKAWAFYLEHGYLQAFIPLAVWQERLAWFNKTSSQRSKEMKEFIIQQLHDEQRLKRFMKHTDENEQQWFFDQLHPQLNSVLLEGKIKFRRTVSFSYFDKKTYLLYLFAEENTYLLHTEEQLPAVDWVIQHHEQHHYRHTKQLQSDAKRSADKKNNVLQQETDTSTIIHNAGIVLLQPFISTLFNELHLLSEDRKLLLDKDRACALLSFLAGDEEQSEVYYPLYKLICGIQLHEFVDATVELTIGQKEECFHLLEQVIHHWPALKQTTVPSLQQTFLQRTGKLSQNDHKWLLQVEQRTEDVLMQYLPWSYSIIHYPWMKQALFVEWT